MSVTGGEVHTIALKSDGTLWAWGNNAYSQLGDGTTVDKNAPVQVGSDTKWVGIAGGRYYTLALKSDGTLWGWGSNTYGQLGDGTTTGQSSPLKVRESNRDWLQVTMGQNHTAALKSDGTLWAWGNNQYGPLGDGTNVAKHIPVQIGTDTKWTGTAAGLAHLVALKSDGTLWAWGNNGNGQLGDGTTTNRQTPVQVGADNNWVSISAGSAYTVALKSNGTLWAWGDNGNGQLGDGTTTNRQTPVQVGTDTKWVSVSTGYSHTIALKSDGTLWAWGNNGQGQLGDGTTTNKTSPTQIGTDTKWTSIGAGLIHTLGLKSNGTLWAWGYNGAGQLGDGTTTNRNSPLQAGTDTKWAGITAGYYHTLGLKSDGTLWTWGYNVYGQLGDGTIAGKTSPIQISSQTQVAALGKGSAGEHSAILKSERNSVCMTGRNNTGQLGDGSTTDRNTFNCASSICRAYAALPSATSTTYTQPLSGVGNRTDFQRNCTLLASVTPSGTAPVSGNLTAFVLNESSVPSYNGHAYVQRHYDLLPAANPDVSTATIILYFTQAEFDAYNAANGTDPDLPTGPNDNTGKSSLRVSQFHGVPTGGYAPANYPTTWSGAGPARVLLTPQSVIWNAEDSRWEVSIDVTGFSGFFVHGNYNNKPLPLMLFSFKARVVGEKEVRLDWLATNTQHDKKYIVERSADGKTFAAIGSVLPTAATDYRLHDYEPLAGKSYYRLRMVGADGQVTYSEIRSVVLDISGNQSTVRVYPSPAKGYVIVESSDGQEISGVITDMQGRTLLTVVVQSGEKVTIASLACGVYLLRTSSGQTIKLVKE